MGLKIKTLAIHGSVWNNAEVRIEPASTKKEETTTIDRKTSFQYRQKYNVFVKSDEGDFNYESDFIIDIDKPVYEQCYTDIKSKKEFKNAINI